MTCQNNGTRLLNTTKCECSCLCPPTFTGHLCQLPIIPINRTYSGQIVIPVNRLGGRKEETKKLFEKKKYSLGSSWENIIQCIDQVWNSLNVLLSKKKKFFLY